MDNFRAFAAGRSRKRWIVHDAMVAARRFRSLSFEAKEPLPEVRRKERLPEKNASSIRKRDDSLFAGQRSIDHSVRPVPVSFEHACQPVNRAASRRAWLCGAHILQMPEKLPASVRQFVEQCKRANIDTIVMLVKGMSGETYWKSRRFPQTIASGYESFDLLEHP